MVVAASNRVRVVILVIMGCSVSTAAQSQVFDVTGWTATSAMGSASGFPFSYAGPNAGYGVTTDNSFTGFSDPIHFVPPLVTSDRIHIWDSGTFQFGHEISGLYVYMAQNEASPGMDILDFGVVPMVVSGDIWTSGTQVGTTSQAGGLIFLAGINGRRLSFTSPIEDDFCVDVALVPVFDSSPPPDPPATPVPSLGSAGTAILLGLLGGLSYRRLRV